VAVSEAKTELTLLQWHRVPSSAHSSPSECWSQWKRLIYTVY